jgi:hypothetical protein
MKEIDESLNKEAVVKKINSLRLAYRKEIEKKLRIPNGQALVKTYTHHIYGILMK